MTWTRTPPRVREWTGDSLPSPRTAPVAIADTKARMVMPIEREKMIRSESYRRWVATLPCAACAIEGYSQAAHPNQGRGLGQKADDLKVFPLCSVRPGHMGCHQMHDLLVDMTLAQRRGLELYYIRKTQATARAVKRPELG